MAERRSHPKVTDRLLGLRHDKLPPATTASFEATQSPKVAGQSCPTIVEASAPGAGIPPNFREFEPMLASLIGQLWPNSAKVGPNSPTSAQLGH